MRTSSLRKRRFGAVAACALAAGCGGSQARLHVFSTDWEDDRGASIARVWERTRAAKIPVAADVVVGVGARSNDLVALSLDDGSKWTASHVLDSRPVIAGGLVVGSGGGELFALEARTGAAVWRYPTSEGALVGAGDDGAITVVTFKPSHEPGSVLLAVGHDGRVLRRIDTSRQLGAPAVVGRMAFVPWAGEYVSVLDVGSGDEVARVTLRSETSHAWTEGGALWFGEESFIRFDERIRDASRGGASSLTLPPRELPGRPRLMPLAGKPVPLAASADDKARVYARPESGDALAFADGRWYGTYFRIAMGFHSGAAARAAHTNDAGALAWVHLHESDFIAGGVAQGGIVLCDERGKITGLDASSGAPAALGDLGEALKSCVVGVDGERLGGTPGDGQPLAAQLSAVVLADDPQLVVAQKLLLRELAALPDETATKALVDLASDPRTSPDLLAEARTALANRRNGASYMEAALARHYDFLRDVLRSPPVGPIAQALGAMKEAAAAPLLASHLLDPADTNDDVMRAAAALAIIARPGELPTLRQFFGMYRASADDDDVAAAVVSVGQALIDLDDKPGRAMVLAAAQDATTVPYARERLQAVVSEERQAEASGRIEDAEKASRKAH